MNRISTNNLLKNRHRFLVKNVKLVPTTREASPQGQHLVYLRLELSLESIHIKHKLRMYLMYQTISLLSIHPVESPVEWWTIKWCGGSSRSEKDTAGCVGVTGWHIRESGPSLPARRSTGPRSARTRPPVWTGSTWGSGPCQSTLETHSKGRRVQSRNTQTTTRLDLLEGQQWICVTVSFISGYPTETLTLVCVLFQCMCGFSQCFSSLQLSVPSNMYVKGVLRQWDSFPASPSRWTRVVVRQWLTGSDTLVEVASSLQSNTNSLMRGNLPIMVDYWTLECRVTTDVTALQRNSS